MLALLTFKTLSVVFEEINCGSVSMSSFTPRSPSEWNSTVDILWLLFRSSISSDLVLGLAVPICLLLVRGLAAADNSASKSAILRVNVVIVVVVIITCSKCWGVLRLLLLLVSSWGVSTWWGLVRIRVGFGGGVEDVPFVAVMWLRMGWDVKIVRWWVMDGRWWWWWWTWGWCVPTDDWLSTASDMTAREGSVLSQGRDYLWLWWTRWAA